MLFAFAASFALRPDSKLMVNLEDLFWPEVGFEADGPKGQYG